MTFRRRITLASSAAVAIAVVLASLLTYVLTSQQLHSQIDTQLRNRAPESRTLQHYLEATRAHARSLSDAERLALGAGGPVQLLPGRAPITNAQRHKPSPSSGSAANLFGKLPTGPNQVRGYQQVVNANGAIIARSLHSVTLPINSGTRALAAHGGKPLLSSAYVDGTHLRVLAESLGSGRAVQFALPLTEVDNLLGRLRLILALLDIGGVALAALLGTLVAGAAVQPLKRLTQATEHVALTQDLSGRIEPSGVDEIGRLASSFNAMLDALELSVSALDASVHAQRHLVADASHELRTPVTSLRTNIEILQQQGGDIGAEDQSRLLADVVEQTEELTLLINDLIDLARGEEPPSDAEEVRLDILVGEVVERAHRHAPATPLEARLEPALVTCVPSRLERAVGNLIDNAIKYSPPERSVEVRLHERQLTVRDHGPGISAEDLPHVFDRFYRGAEARGRPGSGLGLAIVHQVAVQLRGEVSAAPAPGGGTLMTLTLPGVEPMPAAEPLESELASSHSDA